MGRDPERPYLVSSIAWVAGSRARSEEKGEPGAKRTRRKQIAMTARATGIEERMRRIRKEIMEGVVYVCKGPVGKWRREK